MDASTWKSIWGFVFTVSSIMFYVTVAIVAWKGSGDVAHMVREMINNRKQSTN